MKGEDVKHIIVATIAILALILSGIAIFTQEVGEPIKVANNPPIAEINVASTTVEEMEYINFNGSGSTDTDGTIVEYTWDFGDGIKDSGIYSNYCYSSVGTYIVSLTVIDNEGGNGADAIIITVIEGEGTPQNKPPVAVLNVNTTTVEARSYISFNGSESTDTDGIIIEYTWDFGDTTKDSGMYSNHCYSSVGTYNVTLTVVDNEGASDVDSIVITIIEGDSAPQNEPPTAVINVDSTSVEVWTLMSFNGSGSVDTDGMIIEYTWDFDDGIKDSGMYSNHYYSTAGTYNVTLTVIDDEGASDLDWVIITVTAGATPQNNPPVAVINASMTTTEGGDSVSFNGSGSTDSDGAIVEHIWDFGDGIWDTGMYTSHSYRNYEIYNLEFIVTLIAIDNDGAINTTNITDVLRFEPNI